MGEKHKTKKNNKKKKAKRGEGSPNRGKSRKPWSWKKGTSVETPSTPSSGDIRRNGEGGGGNLREAGALRKKRKPAESVSSSGGKRYFSRGSVTRGKWGTPEERGKEADEGLGAKRGGV